MIVILAVLWCILGALVFLEGSKIPSLHECKYWWAIILLAGPIIWLLGAIILLLYIVGIKKHSK